MTQAEQTAQFLKAIEELRAEVAKLKAELAAANGKRWDDILDRLPKNPDPQRRINFLTCSRCGADITYTNVCRCKYYPAYPAPNPPPLSPPIWCSINNPK